MDTDRVFPEAVAIATARAAGLGTLTLWCAPDARQRFFRALQRRGGLDLRSQPDGDLGRRMAHVFAGDRTGPLLLIGSDCPALRPEHLRQAALALCDGLDAVFITAEDGGYVLVGLQQPCAELFAGIEWSSARVMEQTRSRLVGLGLRWQELTTLWDVDQAGDVLRWQALQQTEAGASSRASVSAQLPADHPDFAKARAEEDVAE